MTEAVESVMIALVVETKILESGESKITEEEVERMELIVFRTSIVVSLKKKM